MLNKSPILTLVAALAVSSLFAAQEVTTPPVGFITVNITGAATAPAKPFRYNLVGVNMVNPVEFQGLSGTATTVSSKTQIALTGITAAAFSATNKYFLEIVSGANEGVMIDVQSVADGQVTLVENITTAFSSPVTVVLRKHNTIGSIFGKGSVGGGASTLLLQGGESAAAADNVQIYSNGSAANYYWDDLDERWAGPVAGDNSGAIVYPDQGLIVIRRGAADVSFKVVGSVKTGKTVVNIEPGFNVVSYPYPVETGIGAAGFITANDSTSLTGGESAADADQVSSYSSLSQSASLYYYDTLDNRWTDGATDVGSTFKMPIGGALIIKRLTGRPVVPLVLTQPF